MGRILIAVIMGVTLSLQTVYGASIVGDLKYIPSVNYTNMYVGKHAHVLENELTHERDIGETNMAIENSGLLGKDDTNLHALTDMGFRNTDSLWYLFDTTSQDMQPDYLFVRNNVVIGYFITIHSNGNINNTLVRNIIPSKILETKPFKEKFGNATLLKWRETNSVLELVTAVIPGQGNNFGYYPTAFEVAYSPSIIPETKPTKVNY